MLFHIMEKAKTPLQMEDDEKNEKKIIVTRIMLMIPLKNHISRLIYKKFFSCLFF